MKAGSVCLIFTAAVCFTLEASAQSSLKQEIERVNEKFAEAVANKDANAVMKLYTDDARLMFPHMPVVSGKENIKAFFQQTIDGGITRVSISTEEVNGTDEFAIESGRYAFYAGEQKVDEGKYLVHWKKVDGEWLFYRDMPSTDLPPPQAIARPHQTVGIAVFKVKKENMAKFERFVKDVLMPAVDVSTPGKMQALKSVRMLAGNTVEPDGSQKFIFIFDPRSPEMEYEIEKVLVAKHGPEKGKQLADEFSSLATSFYEYHDMRQLAAD